MMRSTHRSSSPRGFTIFELLVVIAFIGIVSTLFAPNMLRLVRRAKFTGIAQQTESVMRSARQSAIRYNTPAVVQINLVNEEIVAFVDVDGVNVGDPPDGLFNPIAGQPHRTTDFELTRLTLPSSVDFQAPAADPEGAIAGFDNTSFDPALPLDVAIFQPNGSVASEGAFRFADQFNNFLEVRVEPRLTGRVSTLKWSDEESRFLLRNETGKPWKWN